MLLPMDSFLRLARSPMNSNWLQGRTAPTTTSTHIKSILIGNIVSSVGGTPTLAMTGT